MADTEAASAQDDNESVMTRAQCVALQAIGVPMDEIHAIYKIRQTKADGFGQVITIIQNGAVKYLRREECVMNPGMLPLPVMEAMPA